MAASDAPGGGTARTPQPELSISALGTTRVAVNGQDIRLPKRKALALLVYLALTGGRQDTRERLAQLFWSDSAPERARTSLRQTLHELNRHLNQAGFTGLRGDRFSIALDPASLTVDCLVILEMAKAGRVHPRLISETLLSETYLRDLIGIDRAFDVWLVARRQVFHDQLLFALRTSLGAPGTGRAAGIRCAQAILNLDPTQEDACRFLIRGSAAAGDVAGAMRTYRSLWDTLKDEYGTEPDEETISLIADIKRSTVRPTASSSRRAPLATLADIENRAMQRPETGSPAGARLALLIEACDLSRIDRDSGHLAEAFRHELVAFLVRFREWLVIAGSTISAAEFANGRIAGAYAIAMTATCSAHDVNLLVTVRDYETGNHLWSEQFGLNRSTWYESHEAIVRQLAIALNAQISNGRFRRVSPMPINSLHAYDLWLRGHNAIVGYSSEGRETALRMFVECVRCATEFAPGYSSLAQINNSSPFFDPGVRRSAERNQRTLELARRAVELDPADSRAQLALGWSLSLANNHKQAAWHMEQARRQNPGDLWTLLSNALHTGFSGDKTEATNLLNEFVRLSPGPSRIQWSYRVQIGFLAGDLQAAIEAAEHAGDALMPMLAWRAAALALSGNTVKAGEFGQQFLQQARALWLGDEVPSNAAIGRWLLNTFPLANEADWNRLRDGFAAAGIPDGGATFAGW